MAILPTVSVRALKAILDYFESQGASLDVLIPPDRRRSIDFDDADARVSAWLLRGLWVRAEQVLADPFVGLHAAEATEDSTFGVFSFLAVTSPSWRDAIVNVCRFQGLMETGARYELVLRDDLAAYEVRPPLMPGRDRRHLAEFSVAVAFCYSRRNVAADWQPREVYFAHAPPKDAAEPARIFGVPVRYGAAAHGFSFDAALLERPMKRADSALASTLATHAADLLRQVPDDQDVVIATRAHIGHALPSGDPSLAAVAKAMGLTGRTLQRRLDERGTSHRQLVVDVRREVAEDLLGGSQLSLTEVAFVLGFSEVAPFHRAFRKWTGETPGVFRKRVRVST
jgi:AraC-like DNA-binding protein